MISLLTFCAISFTCSFLPVWSHLCRILSTGCLEEEELAKRTGTAEVFRLLKSTVSTRRCLMIVGNLLGRNTIAAIVVLIAQGVIKKAKKIYRFELKKTSTFYWFTIIKLKM